MVSTDLDLNLLIALDALLDERSVRGAAARVHTSAPAMSRTLARLRRILGDPVLVRAGRTMVATPRAVAIQTEVRDIVERAHRVFTATAPDLSTLRRTFAIQAADVIVSTVGSRLLGLAHAQAPGVNVRFVGESHEDLHSLRDGTVDLELGQIRRTEPETHIELLLTEPMVGVARARHLFLTRRVSVAEFAAAEHVVFSRRGRVVGPIDDALAEHGLSRRVAVCTPTALSALFLIKDSDMVGILPVSIVGRLLKDLGLRIFEVPLALPPFQLSMAWHPQHDADGAHAWLRGRVRQALPASQG